MPRNPEKAGNEWSGGRYPKARIAVSKNAADARKTAATGSTDCIAIVANPCCCSDSNFLENERWDLGGKSRKIRSR
jgi:hypothetical protein